MSAAQEVESNMFSLTKRTLTGIALAAAFCLPLIPAPSSAASSNAALQSWNAAPLQSGDLVRLRSGGPLMTVDSVEGNQVNCYWTDWNGQPNAQAFPLNVLQKF
jgi:uncharacterized protein YodC (DUF2158 family)